MRKLLLLQVNKLFIVLLELHFQQAVPYALFILHFLMQVTCHLNGSASETVLETLSKLPALSILSEIRWVK